MTNLAQRDSISEHGSDAAYGLPHNDRLPVIVSCLDRLGIYDKAAHQELCRVIEDGFTGDELSTAKQKAANIDNPWDAWRESSLEAQGHMQAWRAGLEHDRPTDSTLPATGGTKFSLDAPQKPPTWLVENLLAAGRVQMTSGAPGAFKSGLHEAVMAASLLGRPFLGRRVPVMRWLVIDAENHLDDIAARWKALGLKDEHWSSIHLTDQSAAVELGEPRWNQWLAREVEVFKPDVIVIDSAMSCCKLGLGNPEILELYRGTLKPLAANGAAVWFSHHHRKAGGPGSSAALGGMSWEGQADLTYTSTRTKRLTRELQADGTTRTESRFALRYPKSGRGAFLTQDGVEYFEVRGVIEPDGSYRSLRVEHPKAEISLEERFLAALAEGPLGRKVLADKLQVNQTGSPFRAAIDTLTERGEVAKSADGLYERTETA